MAIEKDGDPRRFECISGNHNKFWQIQKVKDPDKGTHGWHVLYGRIDTKGATSSRWFGGAYKRDHELEKLVQSKSDKGYNEVAIVKKKRGVQRTKRTSTVAENVCNTHAPVTTHQNDLPRSRILNLELE